MMAAARPPVAHIFSNTSLATELLNDAPFGQRGQFSERVGDDSGREPTSSSPSSLSLRRTSPCSHTDAALAVAPALTIASK